MRVVDLVAEAELIEATLLFYFLVVDLKSQNCCQAMLN